MKKKLIIFGILTCGCFSTALAQSKLSPVMVAFKEYCIRATLAAAQCNVNQLADCIANWTPPEYDANGNITKDEKFVYKEQKIDYDPIEDFKLVDTLQEIPLVGHFKFLPAEVDNWIVTQCEPVELDGICMLRGRAAFHCDYQIRALAPKGKAVYSMRGNGTAEFFAVAEAGGKINMSIHTIERNYKREILNEADYEDVSANGREYAQLVFSMGRTNEIFITIENTTDKPISFILVKK